MASTLDIGLDPVALANRTDQPFPDNVTLNELFERQARAKPLRTAVFCDDDKFWATPSMSYGLLNARATQVAVRLQALGVKPGMIVGILVQRSYAMLIGIFGILKAGAAYLPLSPDDPADRIQFVLNDAGVEFLLVHGATAAKAPAGPVVLDLEDQALYARPVVDPETVNQPGDLAYVIYTSGSTGRPKGVMIEHRSVVNRLHWMQRAYPIGADDVLLQKTSYCFDVSVWELFWWAIEGAALAMLRPGGEKVPQALLEAVRTHRVTMAHFVPSMLSVFLDALEGRPDKVAASLPSLRRVFASGEALSPAHARKFRAIIGQPTGCQLTNLYGPTEATVDATFFDCPPDADLDLVPIGRPIQNMRAHILRNGVPAAAGESGELCLAGVGLARGYLNNPKLTAERFVDNPANPGERIYRTGDLACWLPDGNIEYLGREDGQVKIRGLRIELGEIENMIRAQAGVVDCVVVARRFSESVTVLAAYYVSAADVTADALRRHLQFSLPAYMVPSQYKRIDAIPLTPSGKADRKALGNG